MRQLSQRQMTGQQLQVEIHSRLPAAQLSTEETECLLETVGLRSCRSAKMTGQQLQVQVNSRLPAAQLSGDRMLIRNLA